MNILLFLIISINVCASNIELSLDHNPQVIKKLLSKLWTTIPYSYEHKQEKKIIENNKNINLHLKSMKFNIPKGSPLFNIEFLEAKNAISIPWKLEKISAQIKIKVRFKFKKFGIKITHDENFLINAKSIKNAKTRVVFALFNNKFSLKTLSNSNFKFSTLKVKPEGTVGTTLRYIFNNVLPRKSIEYLIKEKANMELNKWISKGQILKNLESFANKTLKKQKEKIIHLKQLSSKLKISVKSLMIDKSSAKLSLLNNFIGAENSHDCTDEIILEKNESRLEVNSSIIDKALQNYSLNRSNNRAPLLCIGYQTYNRDGNPLGEGTEIKFLRKKISFNYWIKPITKPYFELFPSKNEIDIQSSFKIFLKSKKYPHLYLNGKSLSLKASIRLKVIQDKLGLSLSFVSFKLESLKGRAQIKWNRFTPRINLPLQYLSKGIEKRVNSTLREKFEKTLILNRELKLNENIKMIINRYKMHKNSHQLSFKLE